MTTYESILQVHAEPYTEEEIQTILLALRETVDQPRRKSDPSPKTFVFDFFGIMNAGKTATTEDVERVFKRNKYKIFCPPETAEIAEIRGDAAGDTLVFQAKHLVGVEHYVANLAFDPRFHAVILSRGLIDMLYWYEKGMRDGIYSAQHATSAKERIFELLRMGLVDAFFYFSCSVDAAIEREYGRSITQQRGSKMNEETISEALTIYEEIISETERSVSGLPLFRIDTTTMTIPDTTNEVFRLLLPTLCAQHNVRPGLYIPYSIPLMRRVAENTGVFEEQLKLRGHAAPDTLKNAGWRLIENVTHHDICLKPKHDPDRDGVFREIIRIRDEGGRLSFIFKSAAHDRIFSHRMPLQQFEITYEERAALLQHYEPVATINKHRTRYQKKLGGAPYYLNCDTIAGLGKFTEIKVLGSPERTHTEKLLGFATTLGFTPADILEGSYLTQALLKNKNKSPA